MIELGDENAQAVVLHARAAVAWSVANGVGEALPQQLQEADLPSGQESQAGIPEQPVPAQEEVPNIPLDLGDDLEVPTTVGKRSIEGGEERKTKVPRLSELPRGEVLQQEGPAGGTTSSSSSTTRLAASPTFAGNITQVTLELCPKSVEVDEEFVLRFYTLKLGKSEDDRPP